MGKLRLSSYQLRRLYRATEEYAKARNIPEGDVYALIETGINEGAYVLSDVQRAERQRLGEHT